MKHMVRMLRCNSASLTSDITGKFVRYGPNRILVNSEQGLHGKCFPTSKYYLNRTLTFSQTFTGMEKTSKSLRVTFQSYLLLEPGAFIHLSTKVCMDASEELSVKDSQMIALRTLSRLLWSIFDASWRKFLGWIQLLMLTDGLIPLT